jgi:hypothetical protein
MAEVINELADKCGINTEMAKKGLEALLGAFKHGLPAESFAKIEGAIPGVKELLAGAQAGGEQAAGGLLAGIKNLAGKLFGGGQGHEALAAHFGEMGFTAEQYGRFLPQVGGWLKSKLPPDVMQKVSALLPHEESASR